MNNFSFSLGFLMYYFSEAFLKFVLRDAPPIDIRTRHLFNNIITVHFIIFIITIES